MRSPPLRTSRSARSRPAPPPRIVREVLGSAGRPLDPTARTYMEGRFGHDFGAIRIHSDTRAATSAKAIDALAYAAGNHVVLGSDAPGLETSQGRRLLAHELAHTVQQDRATGTPRMGNASDGAERGADRIADRVARGLPSGTVARAADPTPVVRRTVGSFSCAPGVFGASAHPRDDVRTADGLAGTRAKTLSDSLRDDARIARGGIPAAPSATFRSYQARFGLPTREGKGFLNRLTGVVRPTLEIATSEELSILSRRFALVASLFSQPINYLCPHDAATVVNLPPWAPGSCGTNDAMSNPSTIALCAGFWNNYDANDSSHAAILMHEAFHMIWDRPDGGPGQIGDATQRGPGRNFNVAGCYEGIIDDFFTINSGVSCPPVP